MNLHPKTTAAGLTGATVTLVVVILGAFHVSVPQDVAAASAGFLAALGAYLAPGGPTV